VLGVLEVILRHDPIPGQSFGTGQGQIAFIVSFGVLSVSRLGAGESGRLISPGGLGASRHRVGHNLRIWAWLRRCGFRFRNVFHVGPYTAPAEAGRRSFEELSSWAPRCGQRSSFEWEQEVGLGTRSTHRELAERIQIDKTHIGGQSGDFKLQLELARPFPWLGISTFTLFSMGWHSADGCYALFCLRWADPHIRPKKFRPFSRNDAQQ
jgi:hypothetical protein